MTKGLDVEVSKSDLLLMFLFFCISGNVLFTSRYIYPIFFVVLYLWGTKRIHKNQTYPEIQKWGVIMCAIFLGQFFNLHFISLLGSLNFFIKFSTAILIADLLGRKFPYVAFKVMVFLSAISIVCYTFVVVTGRFSGIVIGRQTSIILYNHILGGLSRNSGMFWEPGAFAGYLMMTIIMFINDPSYLFKHKHGSLIILIALLTTKSTTGYLLFAICWMYNMRSHVKNKLLAIILLILTINIGIFAYKNFDFLGDKIETQFADANELFLSSQGTTDHGRFSSIIFEWKYIKDQPIFGNNFSQETRFRFHPELFFLEQGGGFGNGFAGILSAMGIPFFIYFLFRLYNNKTLLLKETKIFMIIYLVLQLQGETFFNYPFIMAFPFIQFHQGNRLVSAKYTSNSV